MRDYQFHYTHRYTKDGKEFKTVFSIYYTHIIGITNGDVKSKKIYTPSEIIKLENTLRSKFEDGSITDLYFGRSVRITINKCTVTITQS